MLNDADAGRFDVIIAWREDRLYRGVNRAMLEISERVKAGIISVELVKEHYDPAIAEVKAWAAGVELQAKRDRHTMGIAGRLAAGKVWGFSASYGYDYDKKSGGWVINESEKSLVQQVWQWYSSGESLKQIRQRLITGGVKQKGKSSRRYVWGLSSIRDILKQDLYYTGELLITWDGIDYKVPVPSIIDQATYQAVKDRFARYKAYPAGNYKQYALAAGQVYCQVCGVRMMVVKTHAGGKGYCYYCCSGVFNGTSAPGCAGYVRLTKADEEIWGKVWEAISDPEKLEAKINARIAELQADRADAQGDCDQIQAKLGEISFKRQQAIAWALAKIISEDDLKMQLAGFEWQAASLKHELAEASLLTGNREAKLRAIADDLRSKTEVGRDLLALENPTAEQQAGIFDFKRTIIQGLVTKIDAQPDKTMTVKLEIQDDSSEDLSISEVLSKSGAI
jgi:DNA invertase Pin-like site-specific DNA recombinase